MQVPSSITNLVLMRFKEIDLEKKPHDLMSTILLMDPCNK